MEGTVKVSSQAKARAGVQAGAGEGHTVAGSQTGCARLVAVALGRREAVAEPAVVALGDRAASGPADSVCRAQILGSGGGLVPRYTGPKRASQPTAGDGAAEPPLAAGSGSDTGRTMSTITGDDKPRRAVRVDGVRTRSYAQMVQARQQRWRGDATRAIRSGREGLTGPSQMVANAGRGGRGYLWR
ncbi:hypothetical protein GGTG_01482 [Gaeumannomyces tritici R3-111a-1]|uniref:Uncharacterized protein n=1 Tax=Gaeumannomyces tritici (strain R3-111a-1) TaxID=644352 RepID=J3NJQ2_GAET3|nr:hypothetical protein GGTG_01482 [Gaeumannomyces tritici R3-111a-1]EJT81504.1 hypothetical protein GGTG_01482 [Gaeumannomyces tritici R3-111a-1]